MFTGLVEELGTIRRVSTSLEGKNFEIAAQKVLDQIAVGDSIAIDGVCLTVVSFGKSGFTAQAVQETLTISTLKYFKSGTIVNLERAMAANGRFGGHFVQGHVDGVGKITDIRNTGKAALVSVEIPPDLSRYVIHKGSIAVNGISLTVAEKSSNRIMISVIPTTFENTNLCKRNVHDYVNVEVDMLAKYIEQFVANPAVSGGSISEDTIKKWGYGKS